MQTLPPYITKIIDTFEKNGYQAYAVGGCVRDMLLGKKPDDYDITTNCKPEKVLELFEKTIPTGIKHGTITVLEDGNVVEVTTFRKDGDYSDNRSPDTVLFVDELSQDLSRRDFTINAFAYKGDKIIDLFGGTKDLKNKTIRAIGNPNERFNEDALRILRAFRFAAKLNFKIESNTFNAIKENAVLLKNISVERIFSELSKILLTDNTFVLDDLVGSRCLEHLDIRKIGNSKLLSALPNDLAIRFVAFCHLANVSAYKTAVLLKCDNRLKEYSKKADSLKDFSFTNDKVSFKSAMALTSFQSVKDFLIIQNLIFDQKHNLSLIDEIKNNNEPYKIEHLKISGDEIKEFGLSGKEIGRTLQGLLEDVIKNPQNNQKEKLKNKVT